MEKKYEDDDIEINLLALLFELLTHWKALFLSMILVGAIAFSYTEFLVTPLYESTSELYVLNKSDSLSNLSLSDLQMGTSLTSDYMVIVSGRPVLEQVIKNLDLDETYGQLKNKVSLNNPTNSRLLDITVKDPDPERAKKIADNIADVSAAFIAEKMDQTPPNVIQYGYADNKPVSPSLMKNTAIGVVVGFILAAAIIIITYLMNDTIMTPEDMEKKVGINVLASLPLEETEYDGEKKRHSSKNMKNKKNKVKSA